MNYRSIAVATLQTIGLFVSGLFIPLLVWMVTPVPLILSSVRNNRLHGLIALGLASAVIGVFSGIPVAAFLFLVFGFIAAGNTDGLLLQRKPEVAILMGALPSAVIAGIATAYYYAKTGRSPFAEIETYILGQRDTTATLYSGLGFHEVAAAVSSIPDSSIHYFVLLLPCIVTLMLISIAVCSYLVSRALLIRKPGSGPTLAPLAYGAWHAPDIWVWGLIAALSLFLIPDDTAKIIGWNFLIIFAALYLVQGVALMDHFMKEKMHVHAAVRILIHSIILSLPSILFVIAIGVIDIWADFRKLRTPVQKA
jgi:uncharacterized protein YybS (DUF2232 family)